MFREYKIRQLQKERDLVKANRKVWIAKHKNNIIDEELASVVKDCTTNKQSNL